jgi:hypothetical protein
MRRKLTVVTDEQGNVLGTQLGHGERDPVSGHATFLVAGPGQRPHKIEFVPDRLGSRAEVDAFHSSVAAHLRRSSRG